MAVGDVPMFLLGLKAGDDKLIRMIRKCGILKSGTLVNGVTTMEKTGAGSTGVEKPDRFAFSKLIPAVLRYW